jgi:hypothetical protein
MARAAEPRGVGGWLLLLILWLVLFGTLRSFLINVGGLLALEVDHPALKHHRKTSVAFAATALWITGPGALLGYLTVGWIVLDRMTTASPTAVVLSITASCLFAAAWTVYLKRSRRVALTYS